MLDEQEITGDDEFQCSGAPTGAGEMDRQMLVEVAVLLPLCEAIRNLRTIAGEESLVQLSGVVGPAPLSARQERARSVGAPAPRSTPPGPISWLYSSKPRALGW